MGCSRPRAEGETLDAIVILSNHRGNVKNKRRTKCVVTRQTRGLRHGPMKG
jgi:hypothetical protein